MTVSSGTFITISNYPTDLEDFTIDLSSIDISGYITVPDLTNELDFENFTSFKEEYEWREILKYAKTNEKLHEAIERVKILYYLSKENE